MTAPFDDDLGESSGSAFVFERDPLDATEWTQTTQLLAKDGVADDEFGNVVALSGDTVLVGAKMADDEGGSVYVFQRDAEDPAAWIQAAHLKGHDTVFGDRFGVSVSISGDTAIVGAHRDDDFGPNTGAAYIFQRDPADPLVWTETAKLLPDDIVAFEEFGTAVAISGDIALVASQLHEDAAEASGAVWVFERDAMDASTWNATAKLTASDPDAFDQFGSSVAVDGLTALIGAYRDDEVDSQAGAAYVFERDPDDPALWTETAKLLAGDGDMFDEFGTSVALAGSTALIAAPLDDDLGAMSGSAYVFERDPLDPSVWTQSAKLLASDGRSQDAFGLAIAISGEAPLVASPTAGEIGAAYAYLPIAQPEIRIAGSCPGDATLELSGATPGGAVFVARAANEGQTMISGAHCEELKLGLEAAELLVALTVDEEGGRTVTRLLPDGTCGLYLQAVDAGSCGVGAVTQIPSTRVP